MSMKACARGIAGILALATLGLGLGLAAPQQAEAQPYWVRRDRAIRRTVRAERWAWRRMYNRRYRRYRRAYGWYDRFGVFHVTRWR